MITASQVNELRQITGVGMMECKKALTESKGDMDKAVKVLRESGAAKAAKRAERVAKEGTLGVYVHANQKIVAIVELNCETDFVARNEEFIALAKDFAMQVAAMNPPYTKPEDVPAEVLEQEKDIYRKELANDKKPANIVDKIVEGKLNKFYSENCLLKQVSIKDEKQTIEQMLNAYIAKVGEKIQIGRVQRLAI